MVEIRAISPGGFGEWSERMKFVAADRNVLDPHEDDASSSSDDEEGTVTVFEYAET